jgi:small subunit ribosomal protein S19
MPKFSFKGKPEEELASLSLEEFVKLIPSRQRRALKRGFTESEKNLLATLRGNPKKFVRTRCREMVIIPEMIGKRVGVYNGKEYISVDIKAEMLGHRLGEFSMTRKEVKHSAPGFGATKSSKFIPLK